MKFVKMHGIGNDYVYVDCFQEEVKNPSEVAKKVSDRHYGIGSDGLILVLPSKKSDIKMDMYNLDGTRGMMCGNGIRCVAKFVYDRGYVEKTHFMIETLAGEKEVWVDIGADGKVESVTVDMGVPRLDGKLGEKIIIANQEYQFTGIDMGNPHAIYYVDNLDILKNLDLQKIGRDFENHKRFPERVNSEFIYIEDRKNIHMRVWERGSGETLACGTGATASAYASILHKKVENEVVVHLLGGKLKIQYQPSGHILMTGEAIEVFRGEIDL